MSDSVGEPSADPDATVEGRTAGSWALIGTGSACQRFPRSLSVNPRSQRGASARTPPRAGALNGWRYLPTMASNVGLFRCSSASRFRQRFVGRENLALRRQQYPSRPGPLFSRGATPRGIGAGRPAQSGGVASVFVHLCFSLGVCRRLRFRAAISRQRLRLCHALAYVGWLGIPTTAIA